MDYDNQDASILEELKLLKQEEIDLINRFESFKIKMDQKYDKIMAYVIQKDQNNNSLLNDKKPVSFFFLFYLFQII